MLKSTEMETINGLVSKMSLEDVKMVSERAEYATYIHW